MQRCECSAGRRIRQENILKLAISGIRANRPVGRTDDIQAGYHGFERFRVDDEVPALTTCIHEGGAQGLRPALYAYMADQ